MQTGKDNRNIFHWVFKITEFTEKRKNNRANKPMAEVKKWKKSNLGLKKYKIKNEIAYEINRKQ